MADHTLHVAQLALSALSAAAETEIDPEDRALGTVHIRVGFHSGSVVGTLVGGARPKYTLLGDTMNTASRMESHSERDRITLSREAAAALAQQAPSVRTASRGMVPIKGKGLQQLFWLVDSPEAVAACAACLAGGGSATSSDRNGGGSGGGESGGGGGGGNGSGGGDGGVGGACEEGNDWTLPSRARAVGRYAAESK